MPASATPRKVPRTPIHPAITTARTINHAVLRIVAMTSPPCFYPTARHCSSWPHSLDSISVRRLRHRRLSEIESPFV